MKFSILTILCLGCVVAIAPCRADEEGAEKKITKSFTVESGGQLEVDVDQGDITIETGNQNTVDIVVEREVKGASEAKEAKLLKSHKVTFTKTEKGVSVEAKTAKAAHSFFSSSTPNLNIHFLITVPRRYNTTLNTAGGNIKITDLNGMVDARTSGGNLDFAKIQGPVEGHTSGGNIKALACADKLTIQTSGGNITIKDYNGPSAQADTSGGNVEVLACTGRLQIKTSGGNIAINKFSGPTVYADTSGGAVSLVMDKQPTEACQLRSSGGNITATLSSTLALNLNAATDGGSVNSGIPVTTEGKQHDGVLQGKINGGGPNLTLKTSGGDIQLVKQ